MEEVDASNDYKKPDEATKPVELDKRLMEGFNNNRPSLSVQLKQNGRQDSSDFGAPPPASRRIFAVFERTCRPCSTETFELTEK